MRGPFTASENPPHEEREKRQRADVPRAELADAVVRHILPEAVPIDHGFLEQNPGIEKREPDREADDARCLYC
jgi:hypothetical protein